MVQIMFHRLLKSELTTYKTNTYKSHLKNRDLPYYCLNQPSAVAKRGPIVRITR